LQHLLAVFHGIYAVREVAKALGAELYFRKPAELKEFMTIGGHIHAVLKQGRSDAASPAGRSNFRSPH